MNVLTDLRWDTKQGGIVMDIKPAASTTAAYKAMSQDDRKALQELRSHAANMIGGEVTLKEIICAVEPDLETPKRLEGI
jgi:hypothetical protein